MKMWVPTRRSATVPLVAIGGDCVRGSAEGGGENRLRVGRTLGKIGIEGSSDDLRHRDSFGLGEFVDPVSLVGGQVHLGPSG